MKSINEDIMLSNYKRKFTNFNKKNADIMIKYLKFLEKIKIFLKHYMDQFIIESI